MANGLNRTMQNFQPLKDQAERVTGIREALLQIHQALGGIYSSVETAEAARVIGGISPQGFDAIRAAVGNALIGVDAAVAVVIPQVKAAQGAIADLADEINAQQIGLQRLAGGNPVGGNGNGNPGFSH